MKTYYTTSFGQPEGYRGGFAVPNPLRAVRGYHGSPPPDPAGPGVSAPYPDYCGFAPVASVGGTTPDFHPFLCCLALVSLLLAARLLAGLPPAEASNLPPAVAEGYLAQHQAPTPQLWGAVAARPVYAARPGFVVARVGPAAPPVLWEATHWLRGSTGHDPP